MFDFPTGQHSRLFPEPDPGVEVSISNSSSQTHRPFLQSTLPGQYIVYCGYLFIYVCLQDIVTAANYNWSKILGAITVLERVYKTKSSWERNKTKILVLTKITFCIWRILVLSLCLYVQVKVNRIKSCSYDFWNLISICEHILHIFEQVTAKPATQEGH